MEIHRRFKSVLLFLVFMAGIGEAKSQLMNHYWTLNFNSESSLLSGAVVAGDAGNTSIYYNPATISEIEAGSNLSFATGLFSWGIYSYRNALGDGIHINGVNFNVLPQFLSYSFRANNSKFSFAVTAITRLKEQMARLFASSVTCSYADGKRFAFQSVQVVDRASLWWDPKTPEQSTLWQSAIVLGEHFFQEIIESPVAVDMRALKVLKQSPMALDIYTLLTYRMSYLRKSTVIPWDGIQQQLGSDYAQTPEGLRNFKKKFIRALSMVHVVYPDANIDVTDTGLILKPSKTHVPMLIK